MAAQFKDVKSLIISEEGGYSNDPYDFGGETKFGISKRSYPHLDIKNLTVEQALEIYEHDWWNRYRLSEFKNQDVANKLMLAIINMGDGDATRHLQKAICYCGIIVKVDGILGSKTIAGANLTLQPWLLDRLRVEYSNRYVEIVDKDASQLKFLKGWLRRALR